mmetsp:Transcript_18768/g.26603  ORF Transcript_18768/g.26603 Transcript_18768/m.26603 type:complete len:667 (+) Transcript_18768:896-2896(+)
MLRTKKIGNLEHLHLYCPSRHLLRVRHFSNSKIEDALQKIYDFASYRERNCSRTGNVRMTTLQENLITAAKEAELQERPTVQQSRLVYESRSTNIAIRSEHDVKLLVCLKQLPLTKTKDYEQFPLCCQFGFIPAIPEGVFDTALATVTDVGFLGFFPKRVYQELRRYAREIESSTPSESPEFTSLFDELIDAFIYRPATIQRAIHFLIAKHTNGIEKLAKRREAKAQSEMNEIPSGPPENTTNSNEQEETPIMSQSLRSQVKRPCHATKCRLLHAKGIVLRQQFCSAGRNICSGCSNEAAKQRKTAQLEKEIMELSVENSILAPLLNIRSGPTSIKNFRHMLICLPSFAPRKNREDCIYGAARYLANTFGLQLEKTQSSTLLDEPMSIPAVKHMWRQATFLCRCPPRQEISTAQTSTVRSFCGICSFLIPLPSAKGCLSCPSCHRQDPWNNDNSPCLSCQFASIVHRNPFGRRYSILQNVWLSTLQESDNSSISDNPDSFPSPSPSTYASPSSQDQLKKMRQAALDESIRSIRAKSSPEENKFVFENLLLLQKELHDASTSKRDFDSILSDSLGTTELIEENLSPRKKGSLTKKLFPEESICSRATASSSRKPLIPIDMNAMHMSSQISKRESENNAKANSFTGRQRKNQQRIMRAKEEKEKRKER